jgi:murein DD-endopeptidase MepM/ murein hydrolase activator NlpD
VRASHPRAVAVVLAFALVASGVSAEPAGEAGTILGLPVSCRLGEECFVQQMPDIDPGPHVLDPLCGRATYQGHDGWDIRVRSLKDIDQPTSVTSVADGIVARIRDDMPDRIFDRVADRELVDGRECGNGVVVEHAKGLVSQYCHLKQGSVSVRPGAHIRKGDRIGSMGASGLAEFPHVHLSIQRKGTTVEPLTGRPLGKAAEFCGDFTNSLFEPAVRQALSRAPTAILDIGLANAPPQLTSLVREGGPPQPKLSEAIVAWVWAINVEQGSQFRIRLLDPNRRPILDLKTKPLETRKANYLAYAGGNIDATEGRYHLDIELLSPDRTIQSAERSFGIVR